LIVIVFDVSPGAKASVPILAKWSLSLVLAVPFPAIGLPDYTLQNVAVRIST